MFYKPVAVLFLGAVLAGTGCGPTESPLEKKRREEAEALSRRHENHRYAKIPMFQDTLEHLIEGIRAGRYDQELGIVSSSQDPILLLRNSPFRMMNEFALRLRQHEPVATAEADSVQRYYAQIVHEMEQEEKERRHAACARESLQRTREAGMTRSQSTLVATLECSEPVRQW